MHRYNLSDENIVKDYAKYEVLLSGLNRDIQRIDLGIEKVGIDFVNGLPVAKFFHSGLDNPIEMSLESHGTQQFVRIFPLVHFTLETGGVAVIDELDAAIHPGILPEILRWFSDPERNRFGAQLWMSCHAVSLLDDLLKEEVLICEKSEAGATQVYRLADIKDIRRDENLQRNYLGGVYGGVPSIG